jgi:MFS family permease
VAVLLWGVETPSGPALSGGATRGLVMLIMLVFAIAGTFAGIAYTDLLGRSLPEARRAMFFVVRQTLTSVGFLISALVARKILACYAYPWNYVWLFSIASGLLLVASFGFWALKEDEVARPAAGLTFTRVIRSLPARLRADTELRRYIYLVNLTGFGLTLMPFYVTLVKERHGLTGEQVGTYLLASIVGMIASNYLWARVVRRHGFRGVIRGCVICGTSLPPLALVLVHSSPGVYLIVFVLMGTALSARKIAFQGLLIEITTAENRALHMGMVGATSLSTAIFPIVAGGLISTVGYAPVFFLGSLLVAWAFRFTAVRATDSSTKAGSVDGKP